MTATTHKHYDSYDLISFIDFANLLPRATQLPDPITLESRGEDLTVLTLLLTRWHESSSRSEFHEAVSRAAKRTGHDDAQGLYALFFAVRKTLDRVAHRAASNEGDKLLVSVPTGRFGRSLTIGEDGKIEVLEDAFYDWFMGALAGQDATRIRHCPICANLLWARRKDQLACTSECANRLRVRRYREKREMVDAASDEKNHLDCSNQGRQRSIATGRSKRDRRKRS